MNFGYKYSYVLIDRGFLEILGPYGISNFISKISRKISLLQTGFIYHYAFLIFIGFLFFFLILILPINFILIDNRLFFLFISLFFIFILN